jgi:manganese efflux pump family protein
LRNRPFAHGLKEEARAFWKASALSAPLVLRAETFKGVPALHPAWLRHSAMIGELLVLGITLSLDNFRTAIALGALRLTWRDAARVALVFGFWDAVAPLVGIIGGDYLAQTIGSTADYVGAAVLGAYGLYLLVRAWRSTEPEEMDERWALFGLPLPLSVDNVVAGTSLGLLGYSPWLAPPLFGAITALMTFVGLQLGRAVAHVINIRSDLLTGVALLIMAILLGLGVE